MQTPCCDAPSTQDSAAQLGGGGMCVQRLQRKHNTRRDSSSRLAAQGDPGAPASSMQAGCSCPHQPCSSAMHRPCPQEHTVPRACTSLV
jgi:hypothetical protein